MSAYTHIVKSANCRRMDEINQAIETQAAEWEGLITAEQIISIQWVPEEQLYYVYWRVRKWLGNQEG